MADTTEMLRIIRHAADRLAEENPVPMFSERIGAMAFSAERTKAVTALMSLRLAMGYAESVLRMVAACMAAEPAPATVAPTAALPAGAFRPAALYAQLDGYRAAADLTWREVASQAGVSASTLTRLGQGHRPDVEGLTRLLRWLGTSDLSPFIGEVASGG